MKRFFIALLLAATLASPLPLSHAQKRKESVATPASQAKQHGVDLITADQIRNYLYFIASDQMEGRDTPSRGLDTTAQFLVSNLSRWGFKPAGDDGTYFQHIGLRTERPDASQTRVEISGQPATMGEDFLPLLISGSAIGPLVFAGNGWLIKAKKMDAYKDIDPKGKIVVVFASPNGVPRGVRGRADLQGKQGEDWMNADDYARKRGAVGVIYVPDFQYLSNWDRTRRRQMETGATFVGGLNPPAPPLPSIIASPKLAAAIFAGESKSAAAIFEAAYGGDGTGMPAPFELNANKTASLTLATRSSKASTQNVVAIWEGSDPVLKDEYVAVGAHYDHVGIGTPVNGDSIYNGADDDGSGTTALLAMAEALAHTNSRPKRSVLFVWHCGEEKGLWGSRYFTDHPTVPLDHIITQLNIDMIGRSKKAGDTNPRNSSLTGPDEIYVIGHTMMSTDLAELSENVNKSFLNIKYDYRYDDPADPNRFFYRSDHFNYARKGIPIIFFFDGVHEDYHQPGDSPDKIDYQKMEKVTRTIYLTLWELGNRATRPKVDKPLPAQLSGQ